MSPAVALEALVVHRGARAVIREVSATVVAGTWLGVIGANGSGKTTLLRAVGGRLPIASGRCLIDGVDLAGNRSARARMIGFAPPADYLPPLLSIRDALELAGGRIDAQRERNTQLWAALGIDTLLDRTLGQASSGMRQRAAIALAFANETAIVVLDEPFNWLDPVAAFDTRAALAAKVALGTTLVTALHDLPTLCGFCDLGIVLTDGGKTLELPRDALRAGYGDLRRFEDDMIAALRR